jgi:predicted alpha/beta-hydrolase family hydrolase
VKTIDLEAPHGTVRVHLHPANGAEAALVMSHGAGGGVEAPDMVAARDAALARGVTAALVEQPYRVAGRKSPAPAHQLDANWVSVLEQLRGDALDGLAVIAGGRSMSARVACRTAAEVGAVAVLCLAFPVRPPQRKGKPPKPDRLDELDAVEVPVLVVQGERDQFGIPPEADGREVALVAGNHGLKADPPAVEAAVGAWLARLRAQQ